MSMTKKIQDMEYCFEQAEVAYNHNDYERGEYYTNEAIRLRTEIREAKANS